MINRNLDLYQNFFSIVADLENSNFRLTILPRHLSQIMLQSKNFPHSPKLFSFWYKNIISTVQKDSPDSRKSSFLQAPILQVMENTGSTPN